MVQHGARHERKKQMSVWHDEKIATWAQAGGVTPFDPACVNPASLDLRLGNLIREPHTMWGEMTDVEWIEMPVADFESLPKWSDPERFDVFWLMPGAFVLCHSLEFVRIPVTVASILVLKSSWGRKGLNHSHSGFGDPGFGLKKAKSLMDSDDGQDGAQWTFELSNIAPWPIKLVAGERVIQQVFFDMADAPNFDYRYTGHYVYQSGATPSFDSLSSVTS